MVHPEAKVKKIVLCGGGTGGHIFPSITVAEILRKHNCDLYYIGVNGKPEEDISDEHGIDFYGYEFSGFPRGLRKELIIRPFNLLNAVAKARLYLKHFKPDIVFGTGGYSAAPVFIAAKGLGIPYIVHNLDVRFGLANKFCASSARLVTLGFESDSEFPRNVKRIVTGNPVRKSFFEVEKKDKAKIFKEFKLNPAKKTIFIIGGSQGANAINEVVLDIMKELIINHDIQIIHQSGESTHDAFLKRIPAKVVETTNYIARPFFNNPEECYAISDLVISRSGAMTVTEVTTLGKPAIFIPYPFVGNHQEANAMHIINAGGALLIRQKNLKPKKLLTTITELLNNEGKLDEMAKITRSFSKTDSAERITEIIMTSIKISDTEAFDNEIFSISY